MFINHIVGLLGLVTLIFVCLAILAAPLVIKGFAPGFTHHDPRLGLASGLLIWTFPYLFFITLTAVCGAILNSYDQFGIPAFTPIWLNIILITCVLFLRPYLHIPIYALGIGVFLAGIVQLAFQLPFLHQKNVLPCPKLSLKDPGVRRVLALMVPALVGVSVMQLGVLIDTIFASFLQTGSVSWLYYSDRMTQLPLGIFGIAIATVILPKLSKYHAMGQFDEYTKTLDWALRILLLIGLPATIGLLILAGPILSTLFQSGQFTANAVRMARESLITFALGLQAFMCIKVFASGFYARQDIKTPVKIAIVALIVNLAANFILIKPLAHAGLALATSMSSWVNAGCLLIFLTKRQFFQFQPGWLVYGIKLMAAGLLMGIFLWIFTPHLDVWITHNRLWRGVHLCYLIGGSSLLYLGSLWLTGLRIYHLRG
jgi:putative peptidoglycan lipid II flippase